MKSLILVLSVGLFFTFAINSTVAQTAKTPDAAIKELYRLHDQDNGQILQGKNYVLLNRFFDKNLAGLIRNDFATHKNEIGVIDFDLFYNTQDDFTGKLSVGQAKIQGAKATVAAVLNRGGRKETITYLLVKQNGAWKIADIKYGGGNTLLKYFKEGV